MFWNTWLLCILPWWLHSAQFCSHHFSASWALLGLKSKDTSTISTTYYYSSSIFKGCQLKKKLDCPGHIGKFGPSTEMFCNIVKKRFENPISIILSNSLVWECFPWYGNILEMALEIFCNYKTSILQERSDQFIQWHADRDSLFPVSPVTRSVRFYPTLLVHKIWQCWLPILYKVRFTDC